jgi:hypothetical protein
VVALPRLVSKHGPWGALVCGFADPLSEIEVAAVTPLTAMMSHAAVAANIVVR